MHLLVLEQVPDPDVLGIVAEKLPHVLHPEVLMLVCKELDPAQVFVNPDADQAFTLVGFPMVYPALQVHRKSPTWLAHEPPLPHKLVIPLHSFMSMHLLVREQPVPVAVRGRIVE